MTIAVDLGRKATKQTKIKWKIPSLLYLSVWENPSEYKGLVFYIERFNYLSFLYQTRWKNPSVQCTQRVKLKPTGLRSAVGKVSGYRCKSDCRSRGQEFDPGPVTYFHGD